MMPEQGHAPEPNVTTVSFTASGMVRILCVLVAAYVVWRLIDLLMLVIIAFVVASAILPIALRLEKRGVPRVWTVTGIFVLIFAGLSVLSVLTAPTISRQLTRLAAHAPEQVSQATSWLTSKLSRLTRHPVQMPEVSGQIGQYLRTVAEHTLQITAGATSAVAALILIIVLVVFMVIDHHRFRSGFLRFVPPGIRNVAAKQWDQVQERMGGYVTGMVLLSLEKGVVLTAALWLIGVPSSLLLGLLACVLNFVPYVGFWSVFLLAEMLAFNANPLKAVWVFVLFLGHEWFKSGFLGPYLVGRTTNLHPAVVLVAIAAGAKLAGLLGTLIAVPIAAAVWVVVTNLLPALPKEVMGAAETHRPQTKPQPALNVPKAR
jgi:predicted PurR-regulated permease PerM